MTSNAVLKKPILALGGHGRAGKDTAAEWLRDNTVLRFEGGCSWAGRHYMAKRLSVDYGRVVTAEEAYATRHGLPGEDPEVMRMKWYNYLNELRAEDPLAVIRLVLETSDLVCGPRDREELLAAREAGLIDLLVWVENPRVKVDPTVTFSREDADIVIYNDSTIEAYLGRWRRLAAVLKILRN